MTRRALLALTAFIPALARRQDAAGAADPGALVRHFWDAFNRAAWDELDGLTTADYVHHPNGGANSLTQFKRGGARIHAGLGGYHLEILDLVVGGDRVAVRWVARGLHRASFFGEAPTNRMVTVYGMHVHRVVHGRIAEDWEVIDTGDLRNQIAA